MRNIYWLSFICKNFYTIRGVENLFLSSGAKTEWKKPISTDMNTGSERMDCFFSWHDGIAQNKPEIFSRILSNVADLIANNIEIPESQRNIAKDIARSLQKEVVLSIDIDTLLATLSRFLAKDGMNKELSILTAAEPLLRLVESERFGPNEFVMYLFVPIQVYMKIEDGKNMHEKVILERIKRILMSSPDEQIINVTIAPKMMEDSEWRSKAVSYLLGENVNNQGRVRSDNVAQIIEDGLRFRSQPEVELYRAIKSLGVPFAPLAVFIRGGKDYRRIEPDFVIWKKGIMMVVEIDGDAFHQETPSSAHNRSTMLIHEGAYMERVNSNECNTPEKANACAKRLLDTLDKLKEARK